MQNDRRLWVTAVLLCVNWHDPLLLRGMGVVYNYFKQLPRSQTNITDPWSALAKEPWSISTLISLLHQYVHPPRGSCTTGRLLKELTRRFSLIIALIKLCVCNLPTWLYKLELQANRRLPLVHLAIYLIVPPRPIRSRPTVLFPVISHILSGREQHMNQQSHKFTSRCDDNITTSLCSLATPPFPFS